MANDPKTYQTIDLTPLIVSLRGKLTDAELLSFANSLDCKDYVSGYSGRVFLEFQAWAARNLKPSAIEHTDVPYDWWEAVRERWAPKWWLRRHPVITRRIVTEWFRVCPHADVRWHDPHRTHINWLGVHGLTRDDIEETAKA